MKLKKLITWCICGILSLGSLTGCGTQIKTLSVRPIQAPSPTPKPTPIPYDTFKTEYDEVITLLEKYEPSMDIAEDDKYSSFKDKAVRCLEFLSAPDANIEDTERENYFLKLQTTIKESKWFGVDTDGDRVSDLTEMLVTNTSPWLKATDTNGKMDSTVVESLKHIIYSKGTNGNTVNGIQYISPEISKYFSKALELDLIPSCKEREYVDIELNMVASDIDSIVVNYKPVTTVRTQINAEVFPITFKLTGLSQYNVPGIIKYYHKNHRDSNRGESYIIYLNKKGQNILDYLTRTAVTTETRGNVDLDKQYYLVFPLSNTLENKSDIEFTEDDFIEESTTSE